MASFTAQGTYHKEMHEAVASEYEKERLRIKNGQCPTCGMQTHKNKKGLLGKTLIPLNNTLVCNGRCLNCNPFAPATATASFAPFYDSPDPSFSKTTSSPHVYASTTLPPSHQMLPHGPSSNSPHNRRRERVIYCGAMGEYDGEVNCSGQWHGRGIFTWDDGSKYDGEWQNGRRQGRGRATYANGDVYEGGFKDGKREGRGTFSYANGNVYEGDYEDGMKEGRGAYTYADGRVEVGQYCEGHAVGKGARWSADGQIAWRLLDGKKQGQISLGGAVAIARRLGLPVPP